MCVFEIGPRDGALYEVLRGHISSALKGALLFAEAQQARIAAEKADQIKTRLLTNVSHELRTPLNIILDTTRNALRASPPDEAALLTDVQHIQHNAEHQLRVINDLLDLSRAEIDELDLYLELIDPRPLLEEAFHSLADSADQRNVTWCLQLPDRLPWLNADAVRLRQTLLNLLSNARKFTEQREYHAGRRSCSAVSAHLGGRYRPGNSRRTARAYLRAVCDGRARSRGGRHRSGVVDHAPPGGAARRIDFAGQRSGAGQYVPHLFAAAALERSARAIDRASATGACC